MKNTMRTLGLLVLLSSFGFSDTIWVPDDHATIQAAIDAAGVGDEVVVRPGTYVENIDFLGKAIAVRSERGAALTIIDGGGAGSVVTFASGEGAGSAIEGFTITNGAGATSGLDQYGGGIFCRTASPTIRRNTITHNAIARGRGGGIYCGEYSFSVIEGNTIVANYGSGGGGGIQCEGGSAPFITRNTIRGNEATSGGGINCDQGAPAVITENRIEENRANGGGGIGCSASSPVIFRNVIRRNVAYGWVPVGGGIGCWNGSSPFIADNLIVENESEEAAGIDCGGRCSPLIYGNTISRNCATFGAAGLWCREYSHPVVVDTIFWDNTSPSIYEIFVGGWASPCSLTLVYSDVKGGESAVGVGQDATLYWGPGMIDADPLFHDADHGDYRLRQDPPQAGIVNPCVDAGDPHSALVAGTTRTDWVLDEGVVDMGFHYGVDLAWAFFRNDAAGSNAEGFTASPPILGEDWIAAVDNTGTGHFAAGIMGYADPLEQYLPEADDFLLIDPLSPGGELLHIAPAFGYDVVTFVLAVPDDPALVGFTLSVQGAGFGGSGGTSLHNAIDLFLGG